MIQKAADIPTRIFQSLPEGHNLEEALSTAERLFQHSWDISVDGMRLVNDKGFIVTVNQAYSRMAGIPIDQLQGRLFTEVYHPDDRPQLLKNFRQQVNAGHLKTHHDFERIMWDGRHAWFEITNSIIPLPHNETLILSLIKDISEQKAARAALEKSEHRFRLLFNSANDAVFVNYLDKDGKLGPFVEVNNVTIQRLLYSREEFVNLNPYSIIPVKYYEKLNAAIADLLQHKHALFEMEYLRKDKRRIPVEISAHLFELGNRPTILFVARNIAERKRAERALEENRNRLRNLAARLQAIREEERSMIAREIHDELGQVLTVLKIQVSLLSNRLQRRQPDLLERCKSLNKMIDQSVDTVQRITAKLRPGILDELGLAAAIEWQAHEFEQNTGITCKYSLPRVELKLDREKSTAVFRILQEALTNVARHANAARVSIFVKKENNQLVVEITDNGDGISKSQINNPKSLGLLGMKERALVFGGKVSINGLSGQGTNVRIDIPLEFS